MRVTKMRKCLAALSVLTLSIAGTTKGSVIVSSSGNTGSTAMQIPSSLPASPWVMAYDPSTASTDLTATASKGLYTQSAGITSASNMTWANVAAGGIQTLLPHTAGTAAVLGLGALDTSATFDPSNVDGSSLGIDNIVMSMKGGQTSTPNDSGELAFLLVQGGKYYRTAWTTFHNTYNNSPITIAPAAFTAASFGQMTITRLGSDGGTTDFTSNPDFSPAGAPIELGYVQGYDSSLGTTDANNRAVVVNWSATVTGVVVPEPASLSIGLIGAGALLSRRQRKMS